MADIHQYNYGTYGFSVFAYSKFMQKYAQQINSQFFKYITKYAILAKC
jgi:hypothetical protein